MATTPRRTVQVFKVDPQLHHPFTCIVAGPSGSGKSTFVKNLFVHKNKYIHQKIDYIYIFIGTSPEANPELNFLKKQANDPEKVYIFNCVEGGMFVDGVKKADEYFRIFIKRLIENRKGEKGVLIFDDLMNELGDMSFLVDLFTKYSSHNNISVILITQNIFYRGKNPSQNMTLYRNTHMLVIFENYLDGTALNTIASRLSTDSANAKKALKEMLRAILKEYRYVVIRGDFKTPDSLRFTSDYFTHVENPLDGKFVSLFTAFALED